MKKKIIFLVAIAAMSTILAVSAFAGVSVDFSVEETTTDAGNACYKVVVTQTDTEGDWRALQTIFNFNYDKIIPIDWYDGSVPSYTGEAAEYPFVFNSFKSGRTSTAELQRPQVPVWTIDGANSQVTVELYWSYVDTYPITASETMIYEMYFKLADGVTIDGLTSTDFVISSIAYGNGANWGYNNDDPNKIEVTNNVVPEVKAITVPVTAGDIVYLQDGTYAAAEATGDYEVLAQDGTVVVNTGKVSQKVYSVDAAAGTATVVAENAVVGSDTLSFRDRTPLLDPATGTEEDRNGIRFKLSANPENKSKNGGVVVEYGFVTTAESAKVGTVDNLTLDHAYARPGAAYSATTGKDAWFEVTDSLWDVRATFYNIPMTKTGVTTKIVSRPYAKLDDGSVIYGEMTKATLYDVCKAIYDNEASFEGCSESQQEYILEVIGLVDGYVVEDEVIIDISGLYE